MLMLVAAPIAVKALAVTARFLKQWKAGSELRNEDTAVVPMVFTVPEWDTVENSNNAQEIRRALASASERAELAGHALSQKGVTS